MKKLILGVMLLSVASVQAITVRNEDPITFEQFSNLLNPLITSGLLEMRFPNVEKPSFAPKADFSFKDSNLFFTEYELFGEDGINNFQRYQRGYDATFRTSGGGPLNFDFYGKDDPEYKKAQAFKQCVIGKTKVVKGTPEWDKAFTWGSSAINACRNDFWYLRLRNENYYKWVKEGTGNLQQKLMLYYRIKLMEGTWNFASEDKWVSVIQSGHLKGASYYRALLTEYLVGRLRVGASIFGSGTFLPEDQQDVVKNFLAQADTYLLQSRYYRNILVGTRSHIVQERIKESQSKDKSGLEYGGVTIKQERERNYFTPIDTFSGVMVVNRTPEKYHVHLGENTDAGIKIASNHVGLCPVKGTSDAWLTGEAKSTRTIDFNFIAAGNLTVNGQAVKGTSFRKFGFRVDYDLLLKETTITYSDDGGAALPLAFDQEKLKKFFGDVGPWAFMVNVVADEKGHQTTEILGLVRLNSYEFPLRFTGPTKGLADGKNGAFDERSFLDMPTNLYKMTQPKSNEKVLPLANRFLQGLFNGYLMMSSYNKKWVEQFNEPYQKHDSWYKVYQLVNQAWKQPDGIDWIKGQIDWRFLRGLMVTKKALSMMYITKKAVVNIKSIFDNPTKSIKDASGNTVYIGATDHYVPVIAVQKGGK